MLTKLLTIINLTGCIAALVYLYCSMRATSRDDAHPLLVRFEWAFLVTLCLNSLHHIRVLLGDPLASYIPTGFSNLTVWVSAILFARYLRYNFK